MRVTDNSNFNTVRDSIQRSKGRMEGLQYQASTLKKVNQPSDNPISAARILQIRTDQSNNDQYQMNAHSAASFLENTDIALSELSEIVLRAKELAIGQASGASSNAETRHTVAEEVSQLFLNALATANRKLGDRYLFGGFRTRSAPVQMDGKYVGDDGQAMVEISKDVFLSSNIPGAEVFNTVPESAESLTVYNQMNAVQDATFQPGEQNVNLFEELRNFKTSLMAGDLETIRSSLERFDQLFSHIVAVRSKLGARLQGLQAAQRGLERHALNHANLSSQLEDADMAEVMSELEREESVLKSSLASSKRLIQPTLLDFLR